jgi:hypothetical protein
MVQLFSAGSRLVIRRFYWVPASSLAWWAQPAISLPGSALGSRPELHGQASRVTRFAPLAIAGSAAGAVLLLITPAGVFGRIVDEAGFVG